MLILSDLEAQVLANLLQRIEGERKISTTVAVKKAEKKTERKRHTARHLAKTLGNSFLNYIKL